MSDEFLLAVQAEVRRLLKEFEVAPGLVRREDGEAVLRAVRAVLLDRLAQAEPAMIVACRGDEREVAEVRSRLKFMREALCSLSLPPPVKERH